MPVDPWLTEQAEWTGHWWLPEEPDEVQPGVLRYDPESGLTLSIVGGFEERIMRQDGPNAWAVLEGSRRWDRMFGAADNKLVTLLDCLPTSSRSYGMGPLAKQSIHAQMALVGIHLANDGDRVFTGCRVSLEGLTDWSADSVFTMTLGVDDDEKLDGRGSIEAIPVDGLSARYGTTTLRLEHHHTLPRFEHRRGSTLGRMTDTAVLYIEPGEPESYAGLRQIALAMRDLLSLATHRAAGVLWLTLSMPPEDVARPEGYPVLPRVISLYEKQTVQGNPDAESENRGPLFDLRDLPFETVVPRWLKIRDRFAATCNLLLGLRYVPGGYLETQFSQAATAAEAMHRALGGKSPVPPTEFRALKKSLRAAVPPERLGWLNERLLHNDPTLKERLLDLAARPDDDAMSTLLPDPDRWATMTTKARNDLAHTGRLSTHDIDDLYAVSRVTVAVVLLNLLYEVGLSGEKQRAVLADNSELSTAVRLSRERCTTTASGD